ncbi:carbamoyltransferase HypF [Streptomyces sp. A7024]|uniref:Carbamoyltransferase n=1 Tax=Streptomyces coryli TaxID=1128680 RepID=A0A6G4TU02_9ACTN|nr:carbamoyltransferase HypF [Streptomyces coryli]NGN62471.1 carbamoyltransferase HypF [Streptomyces coryli]
MNGRESGSRRARRIEVFGTVQGVGFRPFVHRTASGLGLDGWVRNVDGHVEVAAAGRPAALDALVERLRGQAPPLAAVRDVRVGPLNGDTPSAGAGFVVRDSAPPARSPLPREIPADAAICAACLRELFDPADRRFRYPFVNCTDCGPRATVIEELPYDRERTTMRGFPLCPPCAVEYGDPGDRRFHAEPLACPACGPQLAYRRGAEPAATGERALRGAIDAIAEGRIVAIKGLGGYQLVCDAHNATAVAELRRRKRRPDKPFAVMVKDLSVARRLARLDRTEWNALASPARPVVLLDAVAGAAVAPGVHPGTGRIGLFLPTTGLHHLLLAELDRPLVVTSGNVTDEPIAIDDAEAYRTLPADAFLTHNRPIRARYDDSVVQTSGTTLLTVRRARGYAPAPLPLPVPAAQPLLAAGAQLKHTFALAHGRQAVLSAHGGDLEDAGTYAALQTYYAHLTRLTGIEPRVVAHDLHPGYLSTQWARAFPADRRIPVQHHHAHIAACAVEHGIAGPVTGVAFDGLGYGDDGTLWGGEILVADLAGYRRVGRLATAPLPGGAAAVRHPARMALGYLYGAEPLGHDPPPAHLFDAGPEQPLIRTMIERGLNCPHASSAGRLFDAAAALLGLGAEVSYEGQAAVALEAAAGSTPAQPLPWRLVRTGGLWVYDPLPTLTALLEQRAAAEPVGRLAAAFHTTLATATAALVERAVATGAPRTVCLSGGCFANLRLLTELTGLLREQGLTVLTGSAVPVGDGGIAYGQAAVAAALLAEG